MRIVTIPDKGPGGGSKGSLREERAVPSPIGDYVTRINEWSHSSIRMEDETRGPAAPSSIVYYPLPHKCGSRAAVNFASSEAEPPGAVF